MQCQLRRPIASTNYGGELPIGIGVSIDILCCRARQIAIANINWPLHPLEQVQSCRIAVIRASAPHPSTAAHPVTQLGESFVCNLCGIALSGILQRGLQTTQVYQIVTRHRIVILIGRVAVCDWLGFAISGIFMSPAIQAN